MFNHERLKVYKKALDLAKRVPKLAASWPKGSYYLEDQLKRAMSSIVLNTAEGNSRRGIKERARFFDIARGSASESASIIDVAFALNLASEADSVFFKDELLQIVKMLYKLK